MINKVFVIIILKFNTINQEFILVVICILREIFSNRVQSQGRSREGRLLARLRVLFPPGLYQSGQCDEYTGKGIVERMEYRIQYEMGNMSEEKKNTYMMQVEKSGVG